MVEKTTMESKTEDKCERAQTTVTETSVKSDPAFCLGPTIKKTNSEAVDYMLIQ